MTDHAGQQHDGDGIGQRLLGFVAGPLLAAAILIPIHFSPYPLLHRYFLGHPICVGITVLFCVALVSLLRVWRRTRYDLWVLNSLSSRTLAPLELPTTAITIASRAQAWRDHLTTLPEAFARTLLHGRLQEILDRQIRRGHAQHLGTDLRELAERDADQAHDALALVRTAVWAIPMFGFLGTVVGITQTLGGLDFNNSGSAMDQLKAGLNVAFDTTALGILLAVVAIFVQYPVERVQQRLLGRIDRLINQLAPTLLPDGPSLDGADAATTISQVSQRVLETIEKSVETQAQIWRQSIDAAHQFWQLTLSAAGDQVQTALAEAIEGSLAKHSADAERIQREGIEAIDQRWRQWQGTLSDHSRVMAAQQKALIQQGELLAVAADRSDELATLRVSLDQNVVALHQTLETLQTSEDLTSAMRTLGRAIELLADRTQAASPPLRGRAA